MSRNIRNSPSEHANDYCMQTMIGNDGKLYMSLPNKNLVCRWIKVSNKIINTDELYFKTVAKLGPKWEEFNKKIKSKWKEFQKSRKSSRKSRKASRKSSRKTSRKSRKSSRKSRKSIKPSRKSRKSSRKSKK